MKFLTDDFLLGSPTARRLYHEVAASLPIIDYHCHLIPAQIAANKQFSDLYDIWLAGDHYKWRAMRTNGVDERLCTGDAPSRDKYLAWVRTVPHTIRNPLYHWSHLELQRYFAIDCVIDERSADAIWQQANELLPGLRVHDILAKFKVAVICTTDDPVDDLADHKAIAASDLKTRVYPTFRPDKALAVGNTDVFLPWCDQLAAVCNGETSTFDGFLAALRSRHDAFHQIGGRLSDHGLETCFADFPTESEAARIFAQGRRGGAVDAGDQIRFASWMMVYFGILDAEKNWTKQLHLGAMRNNNSRLFAALGADTGFDSIGDFSQARALGRYLDQLDQSNRLPRTIIYNLNPSDNYLFASMIGNFQDGSVAGKLQFGSGWWFNDQKDGMIAQMNALSNLGLLSRFVGMLTDSRSFLSYPRHEYFRRIFCNLVATDVENGEIPNDAELLDTLVYNVCYGNAADYFGFDVPDFG